MKILNRLLIIILFFLTSILIYSQQDEEPPNQEELEIANQCGSDIYIRMYPVSMVFNGYYSVTGKGEDYNLQATRPQGIIPGRHHWWWDYINGVGVYRTTDSGGNWINQPPTAIHKVSSGNSIAYNLDLGETTTQGCFGFGIYKIEFCPNEFFEENVDSVLFEQDLSGMPDVTVSYVLDNSIKKILFIIPGCTTVTVNYNSEDGYFIRFWKLCGFSKAPGNFTYDADSPYNIIPLDSRRDCNITSINQNHFFPGYWDDVNPELRNNDVRQGNLTLNLTIQKNISTPEYTQIYDPNSYKVYTNQMTVTPGVIFTLDAGNILTLNDYNQHPSYVAFTMRVKGRPSPSEYPGVLRLIGNTGDGISRLIVKRKSFLYLEKTSAVRFYGGSKIIVEPGGHICFGGADIRGNGSIEIQGPWTSFCYEDNFDHAFQDSSSLILGDSAIWEIPSNITITFDGSVTNLKMNPNSSIKFGQNSMIVFQNGARLIADSATFTSLDSTSTWDGIYLSDIANDTIKNCVIQNAVNGINIQDKNYCVLGTPTVEISNCTFSNTTNTQLTNGVFVNNCSNVLIKGNNFTSTQLNQGFANGVMVEYCLPGSPVLVDNNIDKVLTGVFVVQSSPYIARNTITGVTASGKGIELDNTNGTIKYNILNNFVNSYVTSYSSPYLLKNTFSGASETNLSLSTYSIPVMRPVNSGSTLSWVAGNNYIIGSPSNTGISYEDESYPSIDSGFNIINLNGSNYMSGEIPSSQDGGLMATMNYWTDDPPASQKFDVSNGDIIYDPAFNGSSYPPIDYTEINNIGFGLYDTVFVETLGDNPGADNLFMQAYQKEREGQFLQAVNKYKDVITSYKNSSYAAISLSRIFNCMEKRLSNVSEYQLLQNYMSQLKASNLYPREFREIAEDYIIKAKVKQGLMQQAISDYETMYQQNHNNMKGVHALINKECLILMSRDTGDAPNSQQNYSNIANHKIKLLSLITGRDLTQLRVTNNNQLPGEYKLYQNYPNPFNPKTTIKYDLPKDGFVTFKVYDVLGKELYTTIDYRTAGTHQITIDGSDYASGLYFYRIEAGNYVETKKMVLVK